jgi:hypothetical protein
MIQLATRQGSSRGRAAPSVGFVVGDMMALPLLRVLRRRHDRATG